MKQWCNTKSVIKWFKAIKNMTKSSFIKFDIAELYPSISKEFLSKDIEYSQSGQPLKKKLYKRYTMLECIGKKKKILNLM